MSSLSVHIDSFAIADIVVDGMFRSDPGVRLKIGPDTSSDATEADKVERSISMDAREARAVAAALWHFASEADDDRGNR